MRNLKLLESACIFNQSRFYPAMLRTYLQRIYRHAMGQAYSHARSSIAASYRPGAAILDCGAYQGGEFEALKSFGIPAEAYTGLEWSLPEVKVARAKGINVSQGDLNQPLPFPDASFDCVFGLSVLEHLLNGCQWIVEARRVLKPGGRLVILTPNIATYFTAVQILFGRMPSTGPHPDSNALQALQTYNLNGIPIDTEGDTPTHRHLVVYSYSALRNLLGNAGFKDIEGRGFGHYPAPVFMQSILQKLDPWHCHQMVFTAHNDQASGHRGGMA
jgi:SAM-dependent methyltransferase